ncbi:MAG TPA: hypothetical protein VFG69_17410 [Nannocystaceae bacterium]|nr:hypothetical protein [Nannocystaceae bacterium]
MTLRLSAAVALALASGCGLRSDPLFEGVLLDEGSGGDDDDESGGTMAACDSPIAMPEGNVTVKGELKGRSEQGGWCGSDSGPEIVYELVAPYTTDISLYLTQSDAPLTLRVEEGVCGSDAAAKICATDFQTQGRHFLAVAGQTYYITVDTDTAAGTKFSFDVVYGWPPLEQCPIHEMTIAQEPGGSFQWFNDFGESQGQVDGFCGGPGRENMFAVTASYPGNMYATVIGDGGFEPVVSLRTNCAAVSELVCDADGPNGYAEASTFIDPAVSPIYYVAVDQVGYQGGSYELIVGFD